MTDDEIAWLRERPEHLRSTMVRFPPMCVVRATKPLVVPAPGKTGEVVSYFDDGTLGVRGEDGIIGGPTKAQCDPDWLEVVGYAEGVTPEDVRAVLELERGRK